MTSNNSVATRWLFALMMLSMGLLVACDHDEPNPIPPDDSTDVVAPIVPRTVPAHDTIIEVGGIAFEMLYVPGGTFWMGASTDVSSPYYDPDSDPSERPLHQVTLSPYLIASEEVSQLLFFAVMGFNPSQLCDQTLPVHNVSFFTAQDFLDSIFVASHYRFRLPTEAEWEYAAKGGGAADANYLFAGSNTVSDVAWYGSNADDQPHQCGRLAPNALGLYDMSGNLKEWCTDWYGPYSSGHQYDPENTTEPNQPNQQKRVVRGGSFKQSPYYLRNTARQYHYPSYEGNDIGFRLVLSVTQ